MSTPKVIIFGATGKVGSAAALAAHAHGAQVYLATRSSPSQPIPSLAGTPAASLPRVQADLTDPDSLRAAVAATGGGATRAFVYLVHGSADGMLSSLTALRSAGVDFVVYLSSYAISAYGGDAADVPAGDFLAFGHAQVERSLAAVFNNESNGGYVAVRPGYFASNAALWKGMVAGAGGEMKIPSRGARFDWVSVEDVGAVAGTILARGAGVVGGRTSVDTVGPEMLSQTEAAEIIGEVLRKKLTFVEPTDEETLKLWVEVRKVPESVARLMSAMLEKREAGTDGLYREPGFSAAALNIQNILGRPAAKFPQWVEEHKGLFSA